MYEYYICKYIYKHPGLSVVKLQIDKIELPSKTIMHHVTFPFSVIKIVKVNL